MSVANLTRYKFNFGQDSCDCTIIDSSDYEFEGGYVKFEEAMEASSNSLQQLKAEIADLVNQMDTSAPIDLPSNLGKWMNKLRQLSAV